MLPKDMLKQKKAKRQAQLVKHVANTLSAIMNNLALSSASEMSCAAAPTGNKSTKKRWPTMAAEVGQYDSLSTQISSSPSLNCFSDGEHNLAFPASESEKKDKEHAKRDKNVDNSSDMRETSWDIPDDAATMWLAYTSDTDINSSGFANRRDKKNPPKAHKLLPRYSQESDISDYNKVIHQIPEKSAGYSGRTTSSIMKPAEQYFNTWYTDNDYYKENMIEKQTMPTKSSVKPILTKQFHTPVSYHNKTINAIKVSLNDSQNHLQSKSKTNKLKSSTKIKKQYSACDSCSSLSENDLKFTTVVRRPELSSSDEDYKDYTSKHRRRPCRNLSSAELQDSADDSPVTDYVGAPKTIGYLVRKPLAKLCITDNRKHKRNPRNSSQTQQRDHIHNKKNFNVFAEGDHVNQKPINQTPRCRTSPHRRTKQKQEEPPIIFMERNTISSGDEDSDTVFVMKSQTDAKTSNPRRLKDAWMSDRRSDKCCYSAIDKALCDLHKCLHKTTKKRGKTK